MIFLKKIKVFFHKKAWTDLWVMILGMALLIKGFVSFDLMEEKKQASFLHYGFIGGGFLAQVTQSHGGYPLPSSEPVARRAYPRGLVPRAEALEYNVRKPQSTEHQDWQEMIDPRYIDTQTLYIAIYQIGMERLHFSTGWVDGSMGPMMEAAVSSFQKSRGLPITGKIDIATSRAIGSIPQPFKLYTITQEDTKNINQPPETFLEKSKTKYLGYYNLWEVLVEKFHVAPYFLRRLNPTVQQLSVGMQVVVPNVESRVPVPTHAQVGEIKVDLSSKSIQVFDKKGNIIAHFPVAIAADKEKAPVGSLKVISNVANPSYLFNPEVLKEIAAKEGLTQKLVIPPGPNNPVGVNWIGLNRPGYGIHGTAVPSQIGQAVSHGCIRLANWNVLKFRQMVRVGSEINVVW
jgi:lipoprotein-anchoring transpeptidase ErfK/SrfK